MKQPRLIQMRIRENQEQELTKPRYKIKNLYTGQVQIPIGDVTANTYWTVKKFAVCYLCPCCQEFVPVNIKGLPHTRIITNVRPFTKSQHVYVKQNNLKSNSKLSLEQIIELENSQNQSQDYLIHFN
ncbi:MAG: hypothetical protein IJ371_00085 [Clostridia bacterium]|nr:hypothetical protein [Clostridia bacterium]